MDLASDCEQGEGGHLGERTEAVDWEMPGALSGLLGSPSMHFSLHKASTPAPVLQHCFSLGQKCPRRICTLRGNGTS